MFSPISFSAVEYYEYGIEHTWAEFRDVCNDVAKAFMALGVGKGDQSDASTLVCIGRALPEIKVKIAFHKIPAFLFFFKSP
ncbi:MAG: hypothetical protein GXP56_13570 [Deltaproteobacteria bacterium]|nr:hypothetical protein [Deltaproteobacteria bacterium]